jgi:hypothetical protein
MGKPVIALLSAAAISLVLPAGAVATPASTSADRVTRVTGATAGTWTFTDYTLDPTSTPEPVERHCHGQLPSSPLDVNSQIVKMKVGGRLELTAHNVLDWAVEVRDAKGNVITGTDVNPPEAEALDVILQKGKYEVVFCNLEGEPEITVDFEVTKV